MSQYMARHRFVFSLHVVVFLAVIPREDDLYPIDIVNMYV